MIAPESPPPGTGVGRVAGARAFCVRHAALLCALVAAGLYAGTLRNLPVLDDGWAVLDNPLVRTLDVGRTLNAQYGAGAGATLAGVYRPVATLTWALGYAVHGRAPLGFHLVNVLLHAAATALVVLLARRLVAAVAPDRAAAASLGAGLLFAVHPVHVEAVAPLVGRADLLAATLGLAALLLALSPRPRWRLPLAWGALALGVLSKETAGAVPLLYALVAVVLPAAAGLDARPGLGALAQRRALRAGVATAAFLALAVVPYFLLKPGGGGVPVEARWFGAQPPIVVWSTMTRALAEYWRALLFPWPLMTDFGYAARIPFTTAFGVESAIATAAWGALLLAGLQAARHVPLLGLGILWGFVALLPVLNVVPIGVLMAERLLYLPSVGICVWAGDRAAAWRARLGGRAGAASVGVASAAGLLLLAGLSVARSAEWRSPRALFEAELRHAPLDPVVNNNLAVEYDAAGEPRRALERLDVALRVAPAYWRAHVNRALALQHLGDAAGALDALLRAVVLAPREAAPRYFTAVVRSERGEWGAALQELQLARSLAPEDPRIALLAGKALAALGRPDEARVELRRAAALDPKDVEAARLLARLGLR